MSRIVIDARIIKSTTGTYVERLLYYLQKLDQTNEYIVLVPSADQNYWRPTAKNFTVELANFKNYSLAEQTKFKRFLEDLKPDLVHFCMPQQPVFYRSKTVTTFHDLTLLKIKPDGKNPLIFKFKQLVGKFIFKNVAHQTKAILSPTEYTKNELLTYYPDINPTKITVTYEASDVNHIKPSKVDLDFKQFIFYAGRFSEYKNIQRLIEAQQNLRQKHPNLGLVLAGPTDDQTYAKLKEYIDEHNYQAVQFVGFLTPAQLAYVYSRATAYVFPSFYEGFGLPGLEVMGFGVPLISSNATCLPEVYGDGAIYFNPSSVADMTQKINLVLSDKTLRQDLIRRGRDRHKFFSWERMARQTLEVYQKVLQDK